MARDIARKYDAGAAAFFLENLCQDVDIILRFGFSLSTDIVRARQLVKRTYASILPEIPELLQSDSNQIRLYLLRRAWELFHEDPEEGVSQTILGDLLRNLEMPTRSALFLVDVFGLTLEEARAVTQMDDDEIRWYLAKGRKKLLKFSFE